MPQWSPTSAAQLGFVPSQRTVAPQAVPQQPLVQQPVQHPMVQQPVQHRVVPARQGLRRPASAVLSWCALAASLLGLAPLGAVLGHVALRRVRLGRASGRAPAMVAVVLAYLTVAAAVVWFAFAVAPGLIRPLV